MTAIRRLTMNQQLFSIITHKKTFVQL